MASITKRIAWTFMVVWSLSFGRLAVVDAQQVTVGVPQQVLSDRFYENFGIGWGFRQQQPGGGGFFFNNGGMGGVLPQFGGFDPNAGANFGFGGAGKNGGFNFNFAAGQGSNRSFTSVTPMVTIPQGGIGSIQSGEIRPFVTGIVPVVGEGGGGFTATNPLTERLQRMQAGEQPGSRHYVQRPPGKTTSGTSTDDATHRPGASGVGASDAESAPDNSTVSTAQRGDLSVKEIQRQRQEAVRAIAGEIAELVSKGEAAEAEGKLSVARVYYQQAQRRATGEQARDLAARVQRLK